MRNPTTLPRVHAGRHHDARRYTSDLNSQELFEFIIPPELQVEQEDLRIKRRP